MPNPNQTALTNAFEGFNFDREQKTKKSAKDSFAAHAKAAPVAPIHDKAALGQWAQQYVVPGMNAEGHNVTDVQGDKLRFKNWQGDYWVDYGRGAGAPGGALAWQAEDALGGGSPAPVAQRQGSNIGVLPGQQSDLMAQILESLQQQGPDPQALLRQQFI